MRLHAGSVLCVAHNEVNEQLAKIEAEYRHSSTGDAAFPKIRLFVILSAAAADADADAADDDACVCRCKAHQVPARSAPCPRLAIDHTAMSTNEIMGNRMIQIFKISLLVEITSRKSKWSNL
jgi:hypothetical protein